MSFLLTFHLTWSKSLKTQDLTFQAPAQLNHMTPLSGLFFFYTGELPADPQEALFSMFPQTKQDYDL